METENLITTIAAVLFLIGVIYFVRKAKKDQKSKEEVQTHKPHSPTSENSRAEQIQKGGLGVGNTIR